MVSSSNSDSIMIAQQRHWYVPDCGCPVCEGCQAQPIVGGFYQVTAMRDQLLLAEPLVQG